MKTKSNKRKEWYLPYEQEEPKREQLVYLAISVSVLIASFLTLIFI